MITNWNQGCKITISSWNIKDFLEGCELKDISDKISIYLKSLEAIANTEEGQKCKRAKELLARYRKNNGVITSEATNNRSVTNTSTTKHKRRSSKVEKKEGEPSSSTRMVFRETKRNTPYTELQETNLGFENNPFLDKENKDEDCELPNYSISSEFELGDASGCSDNGTLDRSNEDIKESLESEEDGFMNDYAKLEHKMNFFNMHIDKKWKLPSGDYVEDILYEHAKDLQYEDQLHSFIIDTSNNAIMDLFKDVDHDYIIIYNASPEPELSDELINYLMRYRKF
ncbi:unnamed protein product [Rhizophagus irregularis]|nr:unnamed protein product [Rhizophagus irregularis]